MKILKIFQVNASSSTICSQSLKKSLSEIFILSAAASIQALFQVQLLVYYSPKTVGLLDPATSDGRVVFVLPWEGQVIAGTTDLKCDVTFDPEPTEKEIDFILDQIKKYLDANVNGNDIFNNFT